jgi:quercetin dioxygenase-like cupin family protein
VTERTPKSEEFALRPSPALRSRVLASVDPATPLAGFAPRLAAFFDLPSERALELLSVARGAAGAAWEAAFVPGVRLHHLAGGPRVEAADCGLVELAPGTLFPPHLHRGDEWSFILAGSAEEEGGERWEPGDLVHRPPGSRHAFRSVGASPLVFAVVLHGGIELAPE